MPLAPVIWRGIGRSQRPGDAPEELLVRAGNRVSWKMSYLLYTLWPYVLGALAIGLLTGFISCSRYDDF